MLLLVLLVTTARCGNKDNPVAPLSSAPSNVRSLKARLSCQAIVLTFEAPSQKTDGSELPLPLSFEVYRRHYMPPAKPTPAPTLQASPVPSALPANGPEAPQIPAATTSKPPVPAPLPKGDFGKIASFTLEAAEEASDKRRESKSVQWIDDGKTGSFQPGLVYLYQVIVVDAEGETSSPSNTAQIEYEMVPAPPENLEVSSESEGIALRWHPRLADCLGNRLQNQDIAGYNVYRSVGETPGTEASMVNSAPVTESHYTDPSIRLDETYHYRVRALLVGSSIESDDSEVAAIKVRDLFPPDPPDGLLATRSRRAVRLLWNPSQASDVEGYHVYRRESRGPWVRLTTEPIQHSSYRDSDVRPNRAYEYHITAVDQSKQHNESQPTTPVKVDGF